MTKHSGVKGKTVPALHRAQAAAQRLAEHAQRDPRKQLDLLDQRPGRSARERTKLAKIVTPETTLVREIFQDPTAGENVAQESNERPKTTARTRRRAQRKATTTRLEN